MSKKIEKILWSGIPTALNASSWTLLSMKVLLFKIDYIFIVLSGVLAWVFYTKDRLNFDKEDLLNNKKKVDWYQSYMKIPYKILIILSIFLLVLRYKMIPLILLGAIATILYTTSFKILNKTLKIKKMFLGKIIFVPLLWVFLTIFIPSFYYGYDFSSLTFIKISIYVFTIIGIQVIINDIDDVVGDKKEEIKTVPVVLGLKKTKFILATLVFISFVIGISLFPLLSLICYTTLILWVMFNYNTSFSYNLKFLNVSLGYIALSLIVNI